MQNPWDKQPFPAKGDSDRLTLAASKGEAIGQWELLEVELGEVYNALTNRPFRSPSGFQEYSAGYNFQTRLDKIERAAEAWRIVNHDQSTDADMHELFRASRGFADRRNEIVHSYIFGVSFGSRSEVIDGKPTLISTYSLFLVPPTYSSKKYDEYLRPTFYTVQSKLIGLGKVSENYVLLQCHFQRNCGVCRTQYRLNDANCDVASMIRRNAQLLAQNSSASDLHINRDSQLF